ncbi:hypothetical protein [Gordonia humi]|uniref:Uncharacterized protein n=1 Tax=Gordonia humi TaxID=686429 RepID=A0A840FFH6_9ACTN|nr:hypothetical protein [Gordonia humi]MBB4138197.1 hypothetical protein [Gordonia humi]
MGWTHSTDTETHEMWIRPEFVDGIGTSASTVREGVTMVGVGDQSWRPAGEVVAWRVVCDCEHQTQVMDPTRSQWVSSNQWVRVPSPSLEDVAAGRIFADDDATPDIGDRDEVADAAKAIWRRHHIRLVDVDEEISLALAAHRAAAVAIDVAITRGRRAGRTWEQIGRVAGMSAPGANSRWKERIESPAVADVVDELDAMITDLDGQVITAAERVGLSSIYQLATRANNGHRPSIADVLTMAARLRPAPNE